MGKHFFKSLEIKNFRGVRESEIEDLARVNLFVGKNGCGKTTFLESLFLLTGISDPNFMILAQNLRGVQLSESEDLKNFFFERNYKDGLSLRGIQESGHRELNVKTRYSGSFVDQSAGRTDIPASKINIMESGAGNTLSGLEYEFFVADEKCQKPRKYNSSNFFVVGSSADQSFPKFHPDTDKRYKERLFGRFITQEGGNSYEPPSIDKMLEEKRKDALLESLQVVEPKISDIKVGPTGAVSVDIGYDRFFPINLLGDGLTNVLSTISAVDGAKDGVLMIDEIGVGLHVSVVKHLWKTLIQQSRKNDVQIFMTTHSKDIVEGLAKSYEEENLLIPEDEESVACFHLRKREGHVEGYRYSPRMLIDVLESDTDIRQ